jgi:hypothetical protein
MYPGRCFFELEVITYKSFRSQVSKAVEAWRTNLTSKNRSKIAASIAHPLENAELFEEGWEDALRREKSGSLAGQFLQPSAPGNCILKTEEHVALGGDGVLVDAT